MIKKLFLILTSIGLSLVVIAKSCEAMILPPDNPSNPQAFYGQDHAYTVTFRGNGEAVVSLRVAFTNTNDSKLSNLTFRVPRVDPKDIVSYQVYREPNCIRFQDIPYNPNVIPVPNKLPTCLEYDEPNYYDIYWYGKISYKKADISYSGDTISITLPKSVEPMKSGSILLYYRALGYTKRATFGSYDYIFETLKTEDQIRNLQVGITTDSDLYLKNTDSKVQYRFDPKFSAAQGMMNESKVAMANPQFDQYYQQIGQGSIVKTATYLQPLDSFSVKGAFADSLIKLYLGKIITVIAVVLIFVVLLGYGISRIIKHFKKSDTSKTNDVSQNTTSNTHSKTGLNVLLMILLSFISSIFVAGYTVFVFLFGNSMSSWYYSEFNSLIVLFLIILSFGIYPVLLLGPSVFMGIKKGLWWGVGTFCLTLLWITMCIFILFSYMILARVRNDYYPKSVPIMNTTFENGADLQKK